MYLPVISNDRVCRLSDRVRKRIMRKFSATLCGRKWRFAEISKFNKVAPLVISKYTVFHVENFRSLWHVWSFPVIRGQVNKLTSVCHCMLLKPGLIIHKIYEISKHSFHTTFSIPLDSTSIHTVYWNVGWTRRNLATTVKFRIHTFHAPPSIPPVSHSIHDVYWNVYWHKRNPAFHRPASIPPVSHSIHDVYWTVYWHIRNPATSV